MTIKHALALILIMAFVSFGVDVIAAAAIAKPTMSYPAPFEGAEIHSTDISAFYKWTGDLLRMDSRSRQPQLWVDKRAMLQALPFGEMVQKVNDITNNYDYVADSINWGVSDYWETPAEFFSHGGDCEDFAIAKYGWLLSLGVSEERLRIAIVYDRIRNGPHALLIVYIDTKAMILDSQVREIRDSHATGRYRMQYSINRRGWWLPIISRGQKVSMLEDARIGGHPLIKFSKDCLAGAFLPECINAIEPAGE